MLEHKELARDNQFCKEMDQPTTDGLNSFIVSKIANQMKVSVRFKSSSQKVGGKKTGKYKYWSAVGLIVDKLEEEMKPI